MNLRIFFDPVDEVIAEIDSNPNSFLKNIEINTGNFPLWPEADMAIIGISEERGSYQNQGTANGENLIRKVLYKLKRGQSKYNIVDLGNLRNGVSLEESHTRLSEVCAALHRKNTIPIIIGGTHDFTIAQLTARAEFPNSHLLVIDSALDMTDNFGSLHNANFLSEILTGGAEKLSTFTHLGYQSFLNDQQHLHFLNQQAYNQMRLGELRKNLMEAEPWIREADIFSFDLSAIRMQDAPANELAQPFGISAEEACRLAWFAGMSHQLSSFGIYEYKPELDFRNQSAQVIATMIWYFVEGFYSRSSKPAITDSFLELNQVQLEGSTDALNFYFDNRTGLWYVEMPGENLGELIPCTYQDYIAATEGDLPNRLVSAMSRKMNKSEKLPNLQNPSGH